MRGAGPARQDKLLASLLKHQPRLVNQGSLSGRERLWCALGRPSSLYAHEPPCAGAHLDAGGQNLLLSALVHEGRGLAVDGPGHLGGCRSRSRKPSKQK